MAYKSIGELDAAYEKLLNDDDKKAGGITLAFYRLHHAMISYFRRFSIHYYYTTIINTTLDQDISFFLPLPTSKKRMMQSAGGQTLLVLALALPSIFATDLKKNQKPKSKTSLLKEKQPTVKIKISCPKK